MRVPGLHMPYHATSSAPVRVLPHPRPARISHVDQSPSGVSCCGLAFLSHAARAASASCFSFGSESQCADKLGKGRVGFDFVADWVFWIAAYLCCCKVWHNLAE